MSNCKQCHKPNNNGTKFCTRKCRKAWELKSRASYKKFMQKHCDENGVEYSMTAVFDYEGNSYANQ